MCTGFEFIVYRQFICRDPIYEIMRLINISVMMLMKSAELNQSDYSNRVIWHVKIPTHDLTRLGPVCDTGKIAWMKSAKMSILLLDFWLHFENHSLKYMNTEFEYLDMVLTFTGVLEHVERIFHRIAVFVKCICFILKASIVKYKVTF